MQYFLWQKENRSGRRTCFACAFRQGVQILAPILGTRQVELELCPQNETECGRKTVLLESGQTSPRPALMEHVLSYLAEEIGVGVSLEEEEEEEAIR